MSVSLDIGTLHGGGIVLGYRCPSRCRHCLYDSGPHRDDGKPSAAELDRLLDLLAERGPRARYHVGGGEPMLDRGLLSRCIRGLAERSLALDYVETNAAWVKDEGQARQVLGDLRRAGLRQVLVSVSPFHAEHVPPSRTLALIDAANDVLPGGAFVWIPGFLDLVRRVPPGERLDLDALVAPRGVGLRLARAYGLVPGARAGRFLHAQGLRRPWRDLLRDAACHRRLADTSHFHVDGQGRYVPGLCAGIVLPLTEVPGSVDLDRYPLLASLVQGGLAALVALAQRRGFTPDETYGGACDLCTETRRFLADSEAWPELGPPGFYGMAG